MSVLPGVCPGGNGGEEVPLGAVPVVREGERARRLLSSRIGAMNDFCDAGLVEASVAVVAFKDFEV